MIPYASRTGTKRNLAALRAHGWRLLVSRAGVWRTEGFPYALDNGAWTDFKVAQPFDGPAFVRLIDKLGGGADWIVLPDIVAGGLASLELSLVWLERLRGICPLLLLAVQDGIEPVDVTGIVGPDVGVFLGGSTEWKLARMADWGRFANAQGAHYHVARVNTERRTRMAHVAGADSIDGSSASRFAVTIPMLDSARRQPDLWAPRKCTPSRPDPRGGFTGENHG